MKYEEFREKMITQLGEWVSTELPDKEIKFETVYRINQVLEGISLVSKNKNGYVTVVIYLEELYEDYMKITDFSSLFLFVVNLIMDNLDNIRPLKADELSNMKLEKDKIVYQLINTELNREFLKTIPHRDFLDLSIIYRYILASDDTKQELYSTIINNSNVKAWKLSEQELFDLAKINTQRLFPTTITPISQILEDIEIKKSLLEEMYVITTSNRLKGAVAILDEEKLYKLAEVLDSDLILYPCTLDEFLAVSARTTTVDTADKLVQNVNQEEVDIKQRLSNHSYYYNKELRTITFNTNKTYGRLDDDLFERGGKTYDEI